MDREKIIKELDKRADEVNPWKESPPLRCDIPYPLLCDALALLKKQEGIIKTLEDKNAKLMLFVNEYLKKEREAEAVVRCKDCKYGQYCTDGETTYQCFKWNSGEFGVLHEQDWFCADGERR